MIISCFHIDDARNQKYYEDKYTKREKKAKDYCAVACAFANQVLFPREMTLQVCNSCAKKQIFYQKTYFQVILRNAFVIIYNKNIPKN